MTIDELPLEHQQELRESKPAFVSQRENNIRKVLMYNEAGTRYFLAYREYKGVRYGDYGNPSQWVVRYGKVQFARRHDPLGGIYYEWVNGSTFSSVKGVTIPAYVDTKKEVMQVLNQLIEVGIFNQ